MAMPTFAGVKIEKSAASKAWEAGVDSKIAALEGGLQKLEHSSVASNAMMALLLKANNVPQEEIDAALAQIGGAPPRTLESSHGTVKAQPTGSSSPLPAPCQEVGGPPASSPPPILSQDVREEEEAVAGQDAEMQQSVPATAIVDSLDLLSIETLRKAALRVAW